MRNNPYCNNEGTWLRGSFHGHCVEHSACASIPLAESVTNYETIGAGFVAITDHDHITDLSETEKNHPNLVLLQGFEYSSRENMIFVGKHVEPLFKLPLEEAVAKGSDLLTVIVHPRPHADGRDYWTKPMIEELGVLPDGIEVYNGHYGIATAVARGRQPLYAEFWDEMLTAGHRLWGFANDDFHDPEDFDNAYNMVLVNEVSQFGVIQAAKSGRCYASTGLQLESVSLDENTINVVVDAPCKGTFIGPGGQILSSAQETTSFDYIGNNEAYIRFQGEGETGRIFLQPMWLQDTEER